MVFMYHGVVVFMDCGVGLHTIPHTVAVHDVPGLGVVGGPFRCQGLFLDPPHTCTLGTEISQCAYLPPHTLTTAILGCQPTQTRLA